MNHAIFNQFNITLTLLLALTACGPDKVVSRVYETPGKDGSSCSVESVEQGALISCSDGTGAFVANGRDGAEGEDGADGEDGLDGEPGSFSIVDSVDPCGDDPNHFDEILLVTAGGDYVAYFEDGGKRFLTILECGKTYQTTDKQACKFKINEACEYEEI